MVKELNEQAYEDEELSQRVASFSITLPSDNSVARWERILCPPGLDPLWEEKDGYSVELIISACIVAYPEGSFLEALWAHLERSNVSASREFVNNVTFAVINSSNFMGESNVPHRFYEATRVRMKIFFEKFFSLPSIELISSPTQGRAKLSDSISENVRISSLLKKGKNSHLVDLLEVFVSLSDVIHRRQRGKTTLTHENSFVLHVMREFNFKIFARLSEGKASKMLKAYLEEKLKISS